MSQKRIIYLFILVVIIQLAVPAVMIARRELTLKQGVAFKFETAPVDPYDAFRGRYVNLSFKEEQAPLGRDSNLERGQTAYAYLRKDSNGFAEIYKVKVKPPANENYLKVEVRYIDSQQGQIKFDLPFDRYYLQEEVAQVAEKYYRQVNQDKEIASYVVVRVKSGFGVLEELYLDQQPIYQYIENHL
jgi:uncharacterized membrane-anchored protein